MTEEKHRYTRESGDYDRPRNNDKWDRVNRWIVRSLFPIGAAILGYFLVADREGIKGTGETALGGVHALDVKMGVVENDVEHLKKGQEELKAGVATLGIGQQTILNTLYTLPSARRGEAPTIHEEEKD